jgi:hypothetical protein
MNDIKEDVGDIECLIKHIGEVIGDKELTGVSIAPSNTQRNTLSRSALSQNTKEWRSCCFQINQPATKYFVQVSILSGLIIFSATMLVVDNNCESQRNYGSLLMICLGCFLPSPKMA